MADQCCAGAAGGKDRLNGVHWRRALWIALGLNAAMFAVEGVAGYLSGSRTLQADALDFLGDAANYAISLGVASMALATRARAALPKGLTILAFGFGVTAWALWGLWHGTDPRPFAMSAIGALALAVNVGVTLMFLRYRSGDANMRSVWICSRNDAINNGLVIAAGFAALWTGSGLPDLIVAIIMAALGISGGWSISRQAWREIDMTREAATFEA